MTVEGTPVTEAEFDGMLRSFRTAFRLETRGEYALDYEAAEFAAFLAGNPAPPPRIGWWRPWLDQITALTAAGSRIGRVRILDEPPTDYQRWELWGARWNAAAGEELGCLTRSEAAALGVPDGDWWLLDDDRVIIMRFDPEGRIAGKSLVTDPVTVARHREWRDLAVRNAIPAEKIAA